jgi:Holliday junction resolvase RusA-like endonuclease
MIGALPNSVAFRAAQECDELVFNLGCDFVSARSSRKRKDLVRASTQSALAKYGFTVTSDVQVEVMWMIDERSRYERDDSADLDNALKPLLDGMCGPRGVLVDDSQIQHLSVGWIGLASSVARVEVRVRLNNGFAIEKPHLTFVRMNQTLCWPIDMSWPRTATRIAVEHVKRTMEFRDSILKSTGDYYASKLVMPQQRLFHVSRTRGFPKIAYQEVLRDD